MPFTTVTDAFDEFDENLKLDPDERRAAEAVHNNITALLKDGGLITTAFLQGSFARKTMIAPLRDVDKVVILASSLGELGPDEVMTRIRDAVASQYPDATFDRSRHALKIDFGEESFHFDTVPAWETSSADDDVLIANRDNGGWDRSNTRELIRTIANRNQETGGRFVHQVRMAKQAIFNLVDGIIPGLHVESWAYQAIREGLSHDEAIAQVLAIGAVLLGDQYFEPTGVDMISKRLKAEVVAASQPVVAKAALDARTAVDLAAAGDHDGAIAVWHVLFGDEFPAPALADAEETLQQAFAGGSVTPAGTISSARAGRQIAQPVRPWRCS